MSQSPSDRELARDLKPSTSMEPESTTPKTGANPKKRASADPIDYPRRRATIACEICRSRKSRCDGVRPKCRLCTELNAECVYREPGVKLDAGDKLILERLNNIESLLQANMMRSANGSTARSPAVSSSTLGDALTLGSNGQMPVNGMVSWTSSPSGHNVSTMPKNHTTPALNLLYWPRIRDLVSQRWDPQVIVQLEMQREPLTFSSARSLDFTNAAHYIKAFFERVNVWYACVSPYSWNRLYRIAHNQSFRDCQESCLVLLVLALGNASMEGSISRLPSSRANPPGIAFFAAAWSMLPGFLTRTDVLAAQCQLLAAAYLFYMVRPLEAWNILASTSLKLQLLLSSGLPPADKRLSERIYWNTLLFESDLLAELDLPHSGIVNLEELVGLPGAFEEEGEQPAGRDDLWYFLAEIALRRLLNRVSNSIYTKSSPIKNTASLEPVAAELDAQLTHWYNGLPEPVRFDQHGSPANMTAMAPVKTVLRLRYFACRTIIFRPYVLAVLINESAFLDPAVEEGCRKCLEACIRQLEHVMAHHAGHMPYLWQGALSMVSQTLLIMGATMSESLAALLPPPNQMNAIIDDVIQEVERYSHLAPSLRLSADIIREAEHRRRSLLQAGSDISAPQR